MNKEEEIDLYIKAITTRDPSKRQIKPVDKDAFKLFEDLESESDEDFVMDSDDLSDDVDLNESDEKESSGDEQAKKLESSDSSESVEDKSVTKTQTLKADRDANDSETPLVNNLVDEVPSARSNLNIMVCMMCLLDDTYTDNEIVECDGCGIMVHEDCYKISDTVYLGCDTSDASTDPWFCDACLNHIRNPRCELCPVEGGVFKKTEHNRWVHLLCALYIPGIAFNDTENLTEVTLSEVPQRDWSARECSLCANSFYAKTGICISCDAGLCKNYFHVLCAQREGLLSEPNVDENPDDPYFAQCRQHTDKDVVRRRKKNWIAATNHRKKRLEQWDIENHQSNSRIIRKLDYYSSMYSKSIDLIPPPFVSSTKIPNFLETSPIAVFLFKKKAENLNLPLDILKTQSDIKVTSSGIPAFTPDFVAYFLERERKIDETSSEIVKLESLHRDMQIKEQNASHQFNKMVAKKESTIKEYRECFERLNVILNLTKNLMPDKDLINHINNFVNRFEPINNASINENGSSQTGSLEKENKMESVINECCVCSSVRDQHLLIDCDNCAQFFHLSCLDPPLARMPRKTKLYGWQCSNCGSVGQVEETKTDVDINRPRELRKSSSLKSQYKKLDNHITKKITKSLVNEALRRSVRRNNFDNLDKKDKVELLTIVKRKFKEKRNHGIKKPLPDGKKVRNLVMSKEKNTAANIENGTTENVKAKEDLKVTNAEKETFKAKEIKYESSGKTESTVKKSEPDNKSTKTTIGDSRSNNKAEDKGNVKAHGDKNKKYCKDLKDMLKVKMKSVNFSKKSSVMKEMKANNNNQKLFRAKGMTDGSTKKLEMSTQENSKGNKAKGVSSGAEAKDARISVENDPSKVDLNTNTVQRSIDFEPRRGTQCTGLNKAGNGRSERQDIPMTDVLDPDIRVLYSKNRKRIAPSSDKNIMVKLKRGKYGAYQAKNNVVRKVEGNKMKRVLNNEKRSTSYTKSSTSEGPDINERALTGSDLSRPKASENSKATVIRRKSGRQKKRPSTLGSDFESKTDFKQARSSKISCLNALQSSAAKKRKDSSHKSDTSSISRSASTASKVSNSNKARPLIQAITFYPSSDVSDSSKQSSESEQVRIGVFAKKVPCWSRHSDVSQPRAVEKKSIQIKWHGDLDDEEGTSGAGCQSNTNNGNTTTEATLMDDRPVKFS